MKAIKDISGYRYADESASHAHAYLLPTVIAEMEDFYRKRTGKHDRRVFDLGCGNGAVAARLTKLGYEVTGVDPSIEGIQHANRAHPELRLERGSAYEDLSGQYGQFPVVVSLEVVEHVYAPRDYAATLHSLVEPNGIAIISTPYHGYLKNVAITALNGFDKHVNPLWDHGHIKFWSVATLTTLLLEAGFDKVRFRRVGRIPALAKSMIAVASKGL